MRIEQVVQVFLMRLMVACFYYCTVKFSDNAIVVDNCLLLFSVYVGEIEEKQV